MVNTQLQTNRFMLFFAGILIPGIFLSCSKLPEEEFDIQPPPAVLLKEEVPPQPGIDGIIIIGPRELIPIFKILPLRSGTPVDIAYLKQKQQQKRVNIEIIGVINLDGQFEITSIDDGQFPEVAQYITDSISKWTFTNYKTGVIKFWFDLASKTRIVKIDKTGIEINRQISNLSRVRDGKLHNIIGLNQGDLGFSKF